MAETVIKKMNERTNREDEVIQNYIRQKEYENLANEEMKKRLQLQTKEEMKATLN